MALAMARLGWFRRLLLGMIYAPPVMPEITGLSLLFSSSPSTLIAASDDHARPHHLPPCVSVAVVVVQSRLVG